MSGELVERVARATCEASTQYAWDDTRGSVREWYLQGARAAIAAMREPTEEMCRAGYETNAADFNPAFASGEALTIWQAMIDAALAQAETALKS